ncbi:hypothetical protein TUM20985_18220 [Mycobacterium antarcticum]|nr:hypothetical protein TUM20985_18220 [Mycolicibacterium sp. TUM20985]GLP74629.1 hypothetical protein TUM20983_17390 [Mycolicibacterium sp. TUM20983]GLP80424.1 hypothetical protein TUM20984_18440 [Mycolicibacterium sp. TUM20984]
MLRALGVSGFGRAVADATVTEATTRQSQRGAAPPAAGYRWRAVDVVRACVGRLTMGSLADRCQQLVTLR